MKRLLSPVAALLLCACGGEESSPPGLENGSFAAELGERTIRYEVRGSGPVLMTVPNSWGLTLEGLRALYRPLEEHVTMVYFDPRGMGGSGPVREEGDLGPDAVREDFEALRKHLGLEQVNAIGWSNGATNLILLAAESPDAIASAIFLHGNASFTEEDGKDIAERYPDLIRAFADFRREMAGSRYTPSEESARVKAFDTEVWFPYMYADVEAGRKRLPELFRDAEFSWAHAEYTNRAWPTLDLTSRLSEIRARALVIAGRHDMMPPERSEEIAAGIPGAEFVVFEESGHFAPVEEPERFVETVLRFLNVRGGNGGADETRTRDLRRDRPAF